MKKNISLIVIFAVCTSAVLTAGCGGSKEESVSETDVETETSEEESILKKMEYPNSSEGIMAEHSNYSVNKAFYDEEGNIVSEYYYIDENMFVYESDGGYVHIMEDGQGFGYDSDEDMYFKDIFVGDTYETNLLSDKDVTVYAYDETETIASETEEDGLMVVETVYEFDMEDLTEEERDELTNVEALVYNYRINPDTYEIVSFNVYTRTADGTETLINSTEISYDTEPYKVSEELLTAINGDDVRTMTVIADPGTDNEAAYSQTITKGEGAGFMLYLPEDYTGIYTDEDCTETWNGDIDYENDATLYAAEGK